MIKLLPKFDSSICIKKKFLPIKLIRNSIIEHPKVNRDVFSWGSHTGPIFYCGIDPIEKEHPSIIDKGFYLNARDFYAELREVLQNAINVKK